MNLPKIKTWMLRTVRIPLPVLQRVVADNRQDAMFAMETVDFGAIEPNLVVMKNLPAIVDGFNRTEWAEACCEIGPEWTVGEMTPGVLDHIDQDLRHKIEDETHTAGRAVVYWMPPVSEPSAYGTARVRRALTVPMLDGWELP